MSNLKSGRMIAAIVGGLLAGACDKKAPSASSDSAAAPAMSDAEMIFCGGINSCSGKSACKTQKNECAGKNACKGQGVVETTPADCNAKAGTIQPKLM